MLIRDGKILLIKRVKPDATYYTLPGGTVEEGEEPEVTMAREILEELGSGADVKELLFKIEGKDRKDFYYLVKNFVGEPRLGEPEVSRINPENQYIFEWVDMNDMSNMDDFYIPFARDELLAWWDKAKDR